MPVSVGELLAYLRLDSSGFDRGIKVAQSEMRSATGTADRMGTAVGTTGERLVGAGRAAGVAASGSAKYRAAQLSLVAAQERYNAVLNQGNASTAKLATSEAAVIRANERVATSARAASAAIAAQAVAAKESRGAFGAVRSSMSGFVGTAAKLGLGLGAFALAVKSISAIKAGVAFESDMTRLVTAAGEAKSALGDVSAGVLSISRSTGVSAKELAAAAYVIESAGYHQANGMQTVLKAAAQGAQIEGAAVKEVSNALSSLLVDYHMKATDAATVTSQLVTAVGHGKTTFAQLATALPNVAAAAAALNVTLPETAAAIATITMHGTDAAKAGTYLRQVLGQLGGGGSAKAREVMKGLGIDANELSMALTSGSGHGLLDAITMLQDGIAKHLTPAGLVAIDTFKKSAGSASDYQKMLANLPPSLTTTFGALSAMTGGVKSMQGFLQLGGQNLKTYAANTKVVASATADASGNVKEWGTASQTARVKGERLSAMFNAAAITVTQKLMPPLKAAEGWLADKLPAAVHTLQAILRPFANDVSPLLSGAWHALTAVLSIAASALAIIGKAAQASSGDLGHLALVAVSMYGAFKSIGIGVVVFKAVQTAIILTRVRLLELAGTYRTLAAAEAIFGVGSLAALRSAGGLAGAMSATAVAARRAAIAFSIFRFAALASVSVNADQIGVMKELVGQYKMATNSADMSAKAIIRWASGTKAGMAGMLHFKDVLRDLNITTDQLAAGVSGSDAAYKAFIATAKEHGKVTSDDKELLDKLHGAFKNTTADADKAAGANRKLTAAQKASAAAAKATAAAIDKIAGSTKIGSDVAKHYATMMGIIVNKEGVAAASAPQVTAAIQTMANAYNTASASGSDFLASLDTFSTSAGTAADRAALIGATLKANAGDALGFAAAINATATANKQLGADVKQTASQITKGGESTRTYLRSIVNLKNGTIDYHNAASGPLINDLQTIQTNAINAAVATYQHNRALMGGKAAADSAVSGYMGVEHSLEGQLEKLGLTSKAAKDLTQKYLGVPKNVRTAIKQEGADPIVAVLDRIGQLLANLTGQSWDIGVNVIVNKIINATAGVQGSKNNDPRLSGKASGGGLPEGVSAVGELGPELAVKSGGHVQILSNAQSKQYLSATGMKAPGFASGTLNPHTFQRSLGGDGSSERTAFQSMLDVGNKAGISQALAKELIAENKVLGREIALRNRYADRLKAANQRLADAQKKLADEAAAVKGAITGSFDVTSAGTGFDGQQPITGANMIAEEKQAATRAHAFVAAIKKLKGRIGAGYLYQLAEKGPGALPEAQALLSLNRSDLKAFNASAASLNTSGNQLGSYIGGMRFGGQVHRDAAVVAADRARLRAENRTVDHLGKKIVQQLERGIERLSHPKITVYLDGKKIATAVASGAKKNGARN